MPEQKMSISFRIDDGVIKHNNRDIQPKNVDLSRTENNIIYAQTDLREFYHQLFDEALAEYNAKQNRSDRKIADYYEHIRKADKGKLFYEVVVQFGDLQNCGVSSENWETAKTMLDEYIREFEKRNPNLKVFNAAMHLDESTPHLHIDFVPIARKNKKGLSLKNSMSGALREQGFSSSNRNQNEWTAWEESERTVMEQILHKHGIVRDDKNVHREHLTVDEYKRTAAAAKKINELNARITELKKKGAETYSAEEITLIKNQNDYLRGVITEYEQKLNTLSRQVNSDFASIEDYDDDKLQYIADGLRKANIPTVLENHTLYFPIYGQNTAEFIASRYKPIQGSLSIREKIKLDIDILIYSSDNTDDLFEKMKEHGYDIKFGKYVSVKHPTAERFVRLKTLGEAYLTENLAKRISEGTMFEHKIRKRIPTSTAAAVSIYSSVLNTCAAIKQFKANAVKCNPEQVYSFKNDVHIDNMLNMIWVADRLSITSLDSAYAKARMLQKDIEWIREGGTEPGQLVSDLEEINNFISMYEKYIIGNYIDNRINEQKTAKTAQTAPHTPKHRR